MKTPKALGNEQTRNLLQGLKMQRGKGLGARAVDDAIAGAVCAAEETDSATRPLSRWKLSLVLSLCADITTEAALLVLPAPCSPRTARKYAAAARVASHAIATHLQANNEAAPESEQEAELRWQASPAGWAFSHPAPYASDSHTVEGQTRAVQGALALLAMRSLPPACMGGHWSADPDPASG